MLKRQSKSILSDPHGMGLVFLQRQCGLWEFGNNWNQAGELRGSECSRVEDSSFCTQKLSCAADTQTQKQDGYGQKHRARGGEGEGGRREGPSKRTLATKTGIVLWSSPPLLTSLHEI